MNSQFLPLNPGQIIRVTFERPFDGGPRLEGSLAAAATLAPVIPIFPGGSIRRFPSRRSARSQS